jgi:RNA polymerase sigma-70 factor (ECF subfamily)
MTKSPRFTKFYKKFSTPLFRFIAKRIGANEDLTTEIFEETIVAAWKGLKTFRHKSSYFTWLCRIALNKIADYYHDQVHRNSRIVVPLIDSLTDIDTKSLSPEENMALSELKASVNSCLNLLPYEKRRLLWFRYYMDLSYEQIGKLLGISPRAVEGRLYRAKDSFARVYTSKPPEEILARH